MSGHGAPAERATSAPLLAPRRTSGRIVRLPLYDVRVKRELAHRRFVLSLLRQSLRVLMLHALDAAAAFAAFRVAAFASAEMPPVRSTVALVAFILVGLNARGNYRAGHARRDAGRLVGGVGIGLLLAAIPMTLPLYGVSLSFLLVFGLAGIATLIVERECVNAVIHEFYARGYGLRRALLIARPHEVRDLLAGLMPQHSERPADDQLVVGYVTPDGRTDETALGTTDDLERILDEHDVSEVLVGTTLRSDVLADVADTCFERGARVLVIPPAPNTLRGWAEVTRIGNWPAYQLHPRRLELPALILKRATDLVLASIALLLVAPLMLVIALCIKLEARGNVFFRQQRVGLGGRFFMMWKFRSMYSEAESLQHEIAHLNSYQDGRLFKLPRDPRITRVGRVLRRFSLDELPQLFNILAGDMSLVGPRPPLPSEVKRYESRHYVRLRVVPGLTGPWQVGGRNLITDFEEVVRLEREYIESWSLRSDIEIMFRTIGVVLSGKGAY